MTTTNMSPPLSAAEQARFAEWCRAAAKSLHYSSANPNSRRLASPLSHASAVKRDALEAVADILDGNPTGSGGGMTCHECGNPFDPENGVGAWIAHDGRRLCENCAFDVMRKAFRA